MLAVLPFPKPKVIGPNILGNGTFDDASGWTLTNMTISGGTLNYSGIQAGGASAARTLDSDIPAGSTVRFTATLVSGNAGTPTVTLNGTAFSFPDFPTSGTQSYDISVPNSGSSFSFSARGTRAVALTGALDNFMVQILS